MDDQQKLDDLLTRAYEAAPEPVKAFIDDGKLDDFMLDLQAELKLRVDVSNEVSDRILLSLLGVIEPAALLEELRGAGVAEEQLSKLVEKINAAIFVPLREEVRAPETESVPTPPAPPRAPLVPVPQPLPTPPTPTPAPPIPPAPPVPPPPPIAPPIPAPPPPVAFDTPPPPPAPQVRTMAHDVEAMRNGTAPTPASVQRPVPPPPPAAPSPEPSTPLPPQYARPVMAPAPAEVPERSLGSVPNRQEVTETLKKYGIDPYREAVE